MDFSYEVSRSMAACEGALLLVDAARRKAQTLAMPQSPGTKSEIIPVINKVDLPAADIAARSQIEEVIGLPADDAPGQR